MIICAYLCIMPKSRRNHQKKSLKKRQRGGGEFDLPEVDASKVDTKQADPTQNSVPMNDSTATTETKPKSIFNLWGLIGGRKTSKKKRSKRYRR